MISIKRSVVKSLMEKHNLTEMEVINKIKIMENQPDARWEIIEDMTK